MALTKCDVQGNIIGSLGTTPQERGLTTQEFKDKFDEMPEGIKEYINNVLTAELDAHIADYIAHKADNAAHGLIAVSDWINATLQNGWTGTLQYRKNKIGQLEIKGILTPGTISSGITIFTIPTDYFTSYTPVPIPVFQEDGLVVNGITLYYGGKVNIYPPAAGNITNVISLCYVINGY